MYDWLTDALSESSSLVTANRRLARVLRAEYGAAQVTAGKLAWRSPNIRAWLDWLDTTLASASDQETLPTRINVQQSQCLWERCLRREVDETVASMAHLVRLSRDTWQRLADWQIPITEVARSAQNADQRMFASAAGRYLGILRRERWVDDAGLASLVLELIGKGRVELRDRYTFVGFDRQRPIAASLQSAIRDRQSEINEISASTVATSRYLQEFDDTDAEMRAAGAWARRNIEVEPTARVAVIVPALERDADRIARLFKEGFAPGWQFGSASHSESVNVTYGRKLVDYPAVAVALLLLRWLIRDLSAAEISLLLRTPLVAGEELAGRTRLELRLRQLPDRNWSPSMISSALSGKAPHDGDDGADWLVRVAALTKRRREVPEQASPAEWALIFDEALALFEWPGSSPQNSAEFQLVNRWRELLNEFARLDLVIPRLTLRSALTRLEMIAGDVVFQPESKDALVHLMGTLEASGAEFDAVWISRSTTSNWPPPGVTSVLVSRGLQQRYEMPDSTPGDTAKYAEQLLVRLAASADNLVCSYALDDGGTEQTVTDLLSTLDLATQSAVDDPGWYASKMVTRAQNVVVQDQVPRVTEGEKLYGGASTLQRQMAEPISAFVFGRLGVRLLRPQAVGISASMRGNIIHDVAHNLYAEKPSSSIIRNWHDKELARRINVAVDSAFYSHEKNADKVLRQMLNIERGRVVRLMHDFVKLDRERCEFQIAGVESQLDLATGKVRLAMRADRVDRFPDGSVAILDYKSGAAKKLLRGKDDANEIQLFAYASAIDEPVSALALVNIDSREIVFDGAGRGYTDEALWPALLGQIDGEIEAACRDLESGDVRINIEQGVKDARPLNLLSRYTELRRDR